MIRKLASIRKVGKVQKHPNADLLDLVEVDGWQCVSKRDEFKEGDLGVYFEIDSLLPLNTYFDFLNPNTIRKMNGQEGYRLKTIHLRGELSQGLILPLALFRDKLSEYKEEDDVTEALGVIKYEKEESCNNQQSKGNFPSFIFKTDQERIQNLYNKYSQKYSEEEFEVTLKLDGTSMTAYCLISEDDVSYSYGVCSRNLELKESEDKYWQTFNKDIKEEFIKYCRENNRSLALQGELMGEGIQKNREQIDGYRFFLFDIFDIDARRYLTPNERYEINNILKLYHVPILDNSCQIFKQVDSVKDILKMAEGRSLKHPIREGIVFKSKNYHNNLIISFKSINNTFLEKEKD